MYEFQLDRFESGASVEQVMEGVSRKYGDVSLDPKKKHPKPKKATGEDLQIDADRVQDKKHEKETEERPHLGVDHRMIPKYSISELTAQGNQRSAQIQTIRIIIDLPQLVVYQIAQYFLHY